MMDFDFELLLTVLVGIFGTGFALDVWLWKPARAKALALATANAAGELPQEAQEKIMRQPMFADYSRSFFSCAYVCVSAEVFFYGALPNPFRFYVAYS